MTSTDNTRNVLVFGPGALGYEQMFFNKGFTITNNVADAHIVCFTGGEDVNPALYGELPIPGIVWNDARDKRDTDMFNMALAHRKFMVGICRGGQFLNVMNGGKLWQDVDGHTKYHHLEDLESGASFFVSSTHHQMFRPHTTARIIATSHESTKKHAHNLEWRKTLVAASMFQTHKEHPTFNDIEVCYYQNTRSLCFQPHPEFNGVPECTEYFFAVLDRCYKDAA